jgi:DNA topoisomerase-1
MGYTLIIAEKPDAARRIAEAIADKKPKVVKKNEAEYYEFTVNGKKHVCVPAVGHLFVLSPLKTNKGWSYPIFSYDWTPTYTKKGTEWTRKYFENIKELVKGADEFIDAADVDTEGEVLLYNILRFICGVKDAKRMQFSVDSDEDLLLVNDENIHIVKIGDFVDKFINSLNATSQDGYEMIDVSHLNFKTFSFDPRTFKTSFKKIKALIRHPISTPLLEITLESGRKIKITEGHNLFVLRNGEIKTIPTTDLKIGDFVVAPLSIDETKNHITELCLDEDLKGRKWKLPKKIPITKELVRLIGYYIAEGSCGDRHVSLDFGLHENYLASDSCECIKKVFGHEVKPKPKKSSLNVSFGGKAGVIFFDKILRIGRNSSSKRIPDFIFNVNQELKKEFIKGIFRGDGTATGCSLSFNTSSKTLASQLIYLLLQMKIFADFIEYTFEHKDPLGKLRSETVYRVFINNKIEQEKLISLFPDWEEKLKNYRNNRRKKQKWTNIKEVHTAIPIFESGLPKFSNRKNKFGRVALKKYLKMAKIPREKIEFLNRLINSNLVFLRVNKIKKVKPTSKYVYDLSVEDNENFMCGIGGLFAHNSTLTKDELIESYRNMSNHILFPMLESGLTRHELDWLWGINLTRALTLALKNHSEKGFAILSAGRVQSPTLNLLLERELEIRKFKPKPFWEIQAYIKIDNKELIATYKKGKIWKKEEADKVVSECKGKNAIIENITRKKYKQTPPAPFNTTDLQAEAYAQFKFSPTQTLNIAESLYQSGAISYPRSASQKLPPSIGYEKIMKALGTLNQYSDFVNELMKKEKLIAKEGPRCVTGDTLILLSNGEILTIKEIVEDKNKTHILGINDKFEIIQEKILEKYKFPAEKVIKIKLANNEDVSVTPDHPILTLVDGKSEWLEAKNIKPGMFIAVPEITIVNRQKKPSSILEIFDLFDFHEQKKILMIFRKSFRRMVKRKTRLRKLTKEIYTNLNLKANTVRSYFQRSKLPYLIVKYLLKKQIVEEKDIKNYIVGYTYASGGNKIIKLPFYLTKDFLYFIGFIAADGHNTGEEITIDNLPKEKEIFIHLSRKIFGLEAKDYKEHIAIASKLLCEIFNKLLVYKGKKARKLDIHNVLLKQPDGLVANYIAGFFDGDGSIFKTGKNINISISSYSKTFLKKLKTILLTFGISSRYHSHDIRIYLEDIPKFEKAIGRFIRIKKERFKRLFKEWKQSKSSKFIFIPKDFLRKKLIEHELSMYKIRKIIGRLRETTKKFYKDSYFIPREKLRRIADLLKDPELEILSNGNINWAEVKSIKIKNYNKNVYDLTTSSHTFIGNNIILHNTDPAHPAVYPTWEVPDLKKLTPQQKKLYDLIVRRFLAVFGQDAIRESNIVTLDVSGHKFVIVGKRTIEPGWTKYYEPYLTREEIILPELKVGEVLEVTKVEQLVKETQPPPRYSQGSIIKELEKRNLGTKATRAEILQTLYDRRYIVGKSIQVTKLGEVVAKTLRDFVPNIVSEELTRHFEKEMEQVFNGKKKREEVVEEAKEVLKEILEEFKSKEDKIGKKLLEGLVISRKEERKIGVCPNCGGELRIIFSRRTGKRFVGCSNYPKCKTGFPLPLVGQITALNKNCEVCGLPMIQVWRKGKRPFRMCINPNCESKKDWNKNKKAKA